MRLPFQGLYILTQEFGVNPERYSQFLVLYPDGQRRPMSGHNGLDFATPHRTELISPHNGTVIEVNFDPQGYGWYVKIENDVEGSVLAHLDTVDVKVGYTLLEGDHIGWSDNSGNSTGPHVHWGYYHIPRNRANGIAGFEDQTTELVGVGISLALGKLPVVSGSKVVNIDTKGLDISNKDTLQTVIDTWYNVANGKYKPVEEYHLLETQLETVKKQLEETQKQDQTVSSDLKHYNELKALGYTTIDDVNKILEKKDAINVALQSEIAEVRRRNAALASDVQKMEEERAESAEQGASQLGQKKEFELTLHELAKITGIEKYSTDTIIKAVYNLQDIYNRLNAPKKEEKVEVKITSDNLIPVKKRDVSWLLNLFQLRKGVN